MRVEAVRVPAVVSTFALNDEGYRKSNLITGSDQAGIEAKSKGQENPVVLPSLERFRDIALHHAGIFDVVSSGYPDLARYNNILKGKAREELKKFKKPHEMIGIKGGNIVSIPVPRIEIPRFTRGYPEGQGGAGQGDGDVGTPIGPGQGDPSQGAGDKPSGHIQDIWVPMSRSEVAKLFIEDLGLPNIQPKGYGGIKEKSIKWNTVSRVGRDLDLQRTIINALARMAAAYGDEYDFTCEDDLDRFLDSVVVEEEDKVYNSWTEVEKPQASAVIFYMMDVSGSMTDEQKERVRTIAWYLSTIIQYQFGKIRAELRGEKFTDDQFGEGIDEVFIIHDANAAEVDEQTFYTTRESGGTKISSAYRLAEDIIKQRYNPALWNIYLFHFSDGDNWGEDNENTIEIIERLLAQVNQIGYIQTESPYGRGEFKEILKDKIGDKYTHIRISEINEGKQEEYRQAVIDMLGEKELDKSSSRVAA